MSVMSADGGVTLPHDIHEVMSEAKRLVLTELNEVVAAETRQVNSMRHPGTHYTDLPV